MNELIPEGYYNAVAVEREGEDGKHKLRWGRSGDGDTPQVLVYFMLLDEPYAGQVLPWFGFFKTSKSAKRTVESLRYMGWQGDDLAEAHNEPLNQKVSIQVEHHEHEGKAYARIAWVNRVGGGTIKLKKPMAPDDLRMFSAKMKSSCSKVERHDGEPVDQLPSPAAAPPAQQRTSNGHDAWNPGQEYQGSGYAGEEDDIPF